MGYCLADPRDKRLPLLHDIAVMEECIGVGARCLWFPGQPHVCLFGSAPRFSMITGDARGHHVVPSVLTISGSWDDMVDSETLSLRTTVLAHECVSMKDRPARELTLHHGLLDHVVQPNDGRDRVGFPHGVDISPSVGKQFRLTDAKQNHRPPHVADV